MRESISNAILNEPMCGGILHRHIYVSNVHLCSAMTSVSFSVSELRLPVHSSMSSSVSADAQFHAGQEGNERQTDLHTFQTQTAQFNRVDTAATRQSRLTSQRNACENVRITCENYNFGM